MRPPGEGSWQGRAAHANDGQVKVKVHEGHQVNIKLPETKWKQRPRFPSASTLWSTPWPTATLTTVFTLSHCPGFPLALFKRRTEQALSSGDRFKKHRAPVLTGNHRDWDCERQDKGLNGIRRWFDSWDFFSILTIAPSHSLVAHETVELGSLEQENKKIIQDK